MIRHTCGAVVPPDVETYVRHLASCPETQDDHAGVCLGIVNAVEYELAHSEPSRETPTETVRISAVMTPSRMAALRDAGKSLRDIAAIAGVAPETVRRRIAKYKRGES